MCVLALQVNFINMCNLMHYNTLYRTIYLVFTCVEKSQLPPKNYWDPNNPHSAKKVTSEDQIFSYEDCKNTEDKLQIDPLFLAPPHLETSIFAALHGNLLPQVLLASEAI